MPPDRRIVRESLAPRQDSAPLRVVHILSGDRWAGAEVQAFTLLSQLRNVVRLHLVLLNEGELASRCRNAGIDTTVLDESTTNSWQLLQNLRRLLKRLQPDVVHTHRQKENVLGSLANLLAGRAPCLRTVHGAAEFTPSPRQKIQVAADRLCGRYLQQAVIAVSSELKTKLAGDFPARHIRVILNGIDPDLVRSGLSIPEFKTKRPEAVHVGLVGRLEAVKRGDLFLQMAATLLSRQPDTPWAFHLFGDGSQSGNLRKQARELGMDGRVFFHGHRPDAASCIAGLNVMVMPSDHEGLPMAALEAAVLGIPLVAHHTGGLVELLGDDATFLVREHRAEVYAERVWDIVHRRLPAKSLSENYLADRNMSRVLALYEELQPVGSRGCQSGYWSRRARP